MRQTPQNVSPMSNEARNTYVIRQIIHALLSLLRDKPLDQISISELCSHAGVGRASFYRNFKSKEDVLNTYIRQLFFEWTKNSDEDKVHPLHKLILAMFTHFENHRDFYGLLNKRNLIFLLKDVILEICGPRPEHSKTEAYATAFVSYSLYGWTEVWFQRGMLESAEEMALLFKNQGL